MKLSRRGFLPVLLLPWVSCTAVGESPSRKLEKSRLLIGHTKPVNGVAFAPDAKTLATGGSDGLILLWNPATGEERRRFPAVEGRVHSVDFSPDGKVLVSGSSDCIIRLWDVAAGKELHQIHAHPSPVPSAELQVQFSGDGKLLASQGPSWTTCLWDPTTGRRLRRWRASDLNPVPHPNTSLALSPDGTLLASGNPTHDTPITLLDTATGKVHRRLALEERSWAAVALAFSPDGKTLAAGCELSRSKEVILWDAASGREFRRLSGYAGDRYLYPTDVVFTPDGKGLAMSGAGHVVRLVQSADGKELARLEGHKERITCVAFAPDGRSLAASGADGRTLVWETGDLKRR